MRCSFCERRCDLSDDFHGFCQMYKVEEDRVVERYPFRWSGYQSSDIEMIPFYHAYPGTKSLVVGTMGCNLDCKYCLNSHIAKKQVEESRLYALTPEQILKAARLAGCHNIVFGVNEVTVSFPSFLALAKAAKKQGFAVGCLTNGYLTEEAAELLAEHVLFINLSLKSPSNQFYRHYAGINDVGPIIRNLRFFAERVHLEITTPIVQDVNDHEIPEIARLIAEIDPCIPWHLFRLLPEYKMQDYQYPDIKRIEGLLNIARQEVSYVYFSNFVGSKWVSTDCPLCGTPVVKRVALGTCGAQLAADLRVNEQCAGCGYRIPFLKQSASEQVAVS